MMMPPATGRDAGARPRSPAARLMLGTAQFGLAYGVANEVGQVPEDEAFAILDRAGAAGIGLLDTAPAYGTAEELLGRYRRRPGAAPFRLVSKASLGTRTPKAALEGVRRSITEFGGRLEAVLVHAPHELATAAGERLWRGLLDLRDAGACGRVGISAYVEDDPLALARRFGPDLMQVPLSVLDQRLARDGTLDRLAALGVAVHVRSIFLQGVVLADPEDLPATLDALKPHLRRVRASLRAAGLTPLRAALRFALGQGGVEAVAVGVTRLSELDAILAAAEATEAAGETDWRTLAFGDDPTLLDPRRW